MNQEYLLQMHLYDGIIPDSDLDGGGGGGTLLLALATGVISLPDTIIVYFYIETVIVMAKYIS